MVVVSFLLKLIIGVVFAVATLAVLVPVLMAFVPTDGASNDIYGWIVWGLAAFVALIILLAPTIRRAFGRAFLLLGSAFFLLPISSVLLGGRATMEAMSSSPGADDGVTAAVGTVMTGGMALAGGFVGFFLGAIFIIAGLVLALGGRREVVVVERSVSRSDPPIR